MPRQDVPLRLDGGGGGGHNCYYAAALMAHVANTEAPNDAKRPPVSVVEQCPVLRAARHHPASAESNASLHVKHSAPTSPRRCSLRAPHIRRERLPPFKGAAKIDHHKVPPPPPPPRTGRSPARAHGRFTHASWKCDARCSGCSALFARVTKQGVAHIP